MVIKRGNIKNYENSANKHILETVQQGTRLVLISGLF